MIRFGYQPIGKISVMEKFTAVVEKDFSTNLYVGYIPGFPGAHSQGETLDKLQSNLCEVTEMLLTITKTAIDTVD